MTFMDVFLSGGTAMLISLQVFVLWSLITISGLLAVIFLSLCIGMSHNIVNFQVWDLLGRSFRSLTLSLLNSH